ncbi:cyclic-phosphate processing receiver domain-containing protein, partial [Paenibacillus glucanolyticus]
EIYLHTSSPSGRRKMYELLYAHMPEGVQVHNGPMPESVMREVAQGTR